MTILKDYVYVLFISLDLLGFFTSPRKLLKILLTLYIRKKCIILDSKYPRTNGIQNEENRDVVRVQAIMRGKGRTILRTFTLFSWYRREIRFCTYLSKTLLTSPEALELPVNIEVRCIRSSDMLSISRIRYAAAACANMLPRLRHRARLSRV